MSSQNNHEEKPSSTTDEVTIIEDPNVPDRSYGDYYCKLCDSHMNSDNMWEAHITGKRHMKTLRKGDKDSKYNELVDEESAIKYELRNVKDPVVGLSYINEIRRKEPNVPPYYSCYLCHATIATVPLVTEHVISMKHRLNYIRETNADEYEQIHGTNLKPSHMEPLVAETARKLEEQLGRGTVRVKQEKIRQVTTYSSKKSFNVDDDDDYEDNDPKSYKSSKSDSSSWRNGDAERSYGQRERSWSPRDSRNSFKSRSKSRSPNDYRERKREHSMDRNRKSSRREISRSPPPRSPRLRDDSDRRRDDYDRRRDDSDRRRDDSDRRRDDYDRHRGDYDRRRDNYDRQQDDYDRHRDDYDRHRSSSKRDSSPKRDYHRYKDIDDEYSRSSRKSEERVSPYRPKEKTFVYSGDLRSVTSKDISPPPVNRSIVLPKPKSYDSVLQDSLLISDGEFFKFAFYRLKSLPEINTYGEMLALTSIIKILRKQLTELPKEFVTVLVNCQQSMKSGLNSPGLDAGSSAAESRSRRTVDPHDKLFSHPLASSQQTAQPSSYRSSPSTTWQTLPNNRYQEPAKSPANFQSSLVNQYQSAAAGSFSNQGSYQQSNTNIPFPPGSALNNSANIRGLTKNITPQSQLFNYSHFSSGSNAALPGSKSFPHKY